MVSSVFAITPDGPVTQFSLYTNQLWRNAGGELCEAAERHSITAWGQLAIQCCNHLQIGTLDQRTMLVFSIHHDMIDNQIISCSRKRRDRRQVLFCRRQVLFCAYTGTLYPSCSASPMSSPSGPR